MSNGTNPLPKYDAHYLRQRVEAAASWRGPEGDPHYLVKKPDGELDIVRRESPPSDAVAEVDTLSVQPHRPKVIDATITPEDGDVHHLMKYDAVFWSESAVEKFVFPYYASKSMWYAAYYLARLAKGWYGYVPGTLPTGREADETEIPFAIGHVPDSEFVPIDEGGDLEFLFRKKGTVYARSLAELIAEEEARGRGTAGPAPRTPASPDGA